MIIEMEEDLMKCGGYIERNPVLAGLVKDRRDWQGGEIPKRPYFPIFDFMSRVGKIRIFLFFLLLLLKDDFCAKFDLWLYQSTRDQNQSKEKRKYIFLFLAQGKLNC
jgi:hypothetical protein